MAESVSANDLIENLWLEARRETAMAAGELVILQTYSSSTTIRATNAALLCKIRKGACQAPIRVYT